MKFKVTCCALFISIFINSAQGAQQCEIVDEDISAKVDEVNMEIEEQFADIVVSSHELPELRFSNVGLGLDIMQGVGKLGMLAGLGMGIYELEDGIINHKTSSLVNGSLSIASIVAPEIVSSITTELISADIGAITGGASALILAEGMNIASGISSDKMIDKVKQHNSDTAEHYKKTVRLLEKSLDDTKLVISGDGDEYYKVTNEHFANVVVELTKKGIEKFTNGIFLKAFEKNAHKTYRERRNENILYHLEGKDVANNDGLIEELKKVRYLLDEEYRVNSYFVPYAGTYDLSLHYFINIWNPRRELTEEEILKFAKNPVLYSTGFYEEYKPLLGWSRTKNELIFGMVDKMMDDKVSLFKDYHTVSKYIINEYPTIQHKMLKKYNQTIDTQYAWLRLGEEILDYIDYSSEESQRDAEWAFRILMPFIEVFAESSIDKRIIKSIQVSTMTSSFVSELINSGVDITSNDAKNDVMKLANKLGFPASIKNNLSADFEKVKSLTLSRRLKANDIKPLVLTEDEISRHIAETQKLIDDGYLKSRLDTEINSLIKEKVLPNFQGGYKRIPETAQDMSRYHWAYEKSVISILDRYILQFEKKITDDGLERLITELHINYNAFMNNNNVISPKDKWINFSTLGQTENENISLIDFLSKHIKFAPSLVDEILEKATVNFVSMRNNSIPYFSIGDYNYYLGTDIPLSSLDGSQFSVWSESRFNGQYIDSLYKITIDSNTKLSDLIFDSSPSHVITSLAIYDKDNNKIGGPGTQSIYWWGHRNTASPTPPDDYQYKGMRVNK